MPNTIPSNSNKSTTNETLLSFNGSEQFRQLLLAKNLTPYIVEGSWAYPGTVQPTEIILSNLSPVDTPDVSKTIFQKAKENTLLNFYKNSQNLDAAEFVANDSGGVSYQQGGIGNILVQSSEQQVEYSPSVAELLLLNEFFIDSAAVINRFIPQDGYITTFEATDNILPKSLTGPYPNFTPIESGLISIPQTSIINFTTFSTNSGALLNDSYLQQISAGFLAQSFKERVDRELTKYTYGRVNLQAFQDPFSLSLLVSGQQNLIAKNYTITVPDGVFDQAAFLIQRFSGTYLPVSPIEGDYFEAQKQSTTKLGQIAQDTANFFIKPATPTNRSIKFLNNTGSGQKSVLFDNLKYNIYRPKYEENNTQVGLVIDQVFDKNNSIGNLYIPYDSEDIQNLTIPTNVDQLGKTFEGPELDEKYKFGLSSIAYDNDPDPAGGFSWTQSSTINLAGKFIGPNGEQGPLSPEYNGNVQNKLNRSRSDGFEFKKGSILQKTQELVNSAPVNAKDRLTHVGNAISQISKVFSDGYKEITKGSKAKKYITRNGVEVGGEYGRTFTKDIPYLTYNNLQSTTANDNGLETNGNIRKFTYSVLDSTYNKNIAPIKGKESTNIQNGKVKKYMFSIENLAWRNTPEFEDLPACEKGPNGGRIMWFPPYDLTLSNEQSSPQFNETKFIGRPEPIYTYESTTRSSSISWSIIVDHPSILNLIVDKELSKIDSSNNNLVTEIVNSFFNGLKKYDIYELAAKYNTIPKNVLNDIYQEVLGSTSTSPEEIKQVLDEIPPSGGDSGFSETPTTIDGQYIGHSFLFPIFEGDESNKSYEEIFTAYINEQNDYINGNGIQQPLVEAIFPIIDYNFGQMEYLRGEIAEVLLQGCSVEIVFSAPLSLGIGGGTTNTVQLQAWFTAIKNYFNEYEIDGKTIGDYVNKRIKYKTENFGTEKSSSLFFNGSQQNPIDCNSSSFLIEQNDELLAHSFNAAACRAITISKINVTPPDPTSNSGGNNTNPNSAPNPNDLNGQKPNGQISLDTKLKGISKRILRFLLSECDYFEFVKSSDSFIMDSIRNKIKFFNPAFHSITPEGLNSRLVFLHQCVRPGRTIPTKQEDGTNSLTYAFNTNFGTPPILILRFGDFYHTKIVPDNFTIDYDPVLDFNPEGIGIQPMIAKVTLGFKMIGGQGLKEPVNKLQNALSFNYYANTEMYDERADATEDTTAVDLAVLEGILNEEPLPTIFNVNSVDSKGDPFGQIISTTPSENGVQTGTIKYKDFFNKFVETNKSYFQTLVNSYESVINEFNLGVWAQMNQERYYQQGFFEAITANTTSITILGKPVFAEGALSRVAELLVEKIDNGEEGLSIIVNQQGNLSSSTKEKILENYKKQITSAPFEEFTNLSTKIQELSTGQLNMTTYMAKMDFIGFGVDAKVLADNSNKFYILSGQTIGATDTLTEFNVDYRTLMTGITDFYTVVKNKIIFDSSYTSGYTTTYVPLSGLFTNESDSYVYTLLSGKILDQTKRQNFEKKLVENINPSLSGTAFVVVKNYIDNVYLDIFQKEKIKEKEFFNQFKSSPQVSQFLNYNPVDSSNTSLTTKERVMSFVTSGETQDMINAFNNILSTQNLNENYTYFNGKKQFDG
jgi:hypothetical protein